MSVINAIYNANVYVNGVSQLGHAAEFKLPEFEIKQDDYTGLGMFAGVKLPSGVEAPEGEITWNAFYPDVARIINHPFKAVQLMVRGNLQTFDATGLAKEVPIVTTVSAWFSKNALGGYKPHEKAEFSSTYQAVEIRQVVDGRETLYFNALKNEYRVDGVDVLSQFHKNIGA
ncbi:phage major tail tube protein [Simonsiella muelleri]|uniref:phage major tail tube protein n=1 Tax=Simonsiella muelleri TaxID=72 RepID=UPI0028D489E5|nr:phage major tail tube protein [Simonsiella muelleri]